MSDGWRSSVDPGPAGIHVNGMRFALKQLTKHG
jgi:hypothetical protein